MNILCKQNGKRGELYLYDAIGSSFFEDGTTAKSVATALADLKGVSGLDVFINSPGGSVFEGVAIYNQIKRFVGPKDVHIDGLAASIASVIAMCGDTIHVAENAMMMIHKPWGMAMGNAAELRKTADTMDQVEGTLVSTYVGRTGQTEKAISDWLDAETWMNAQECVDRGFADKITADKAITASAMTASVATQHLLAQFRNVPERLKRAPAASARLAALASMDMRATKRK